MKNKETSVEKMVFIIHMNFDFKKLTDEDKRHITIFCKGNKHQLNEAIELLTMAEKYKIHPQKLLVNH